MTRSTDAVIGNRTVGRARRLGKTADMRWFMGVVLALLVVWAGFMVSPYVALWNLASAIDQGDVQALSERVNAYSVRLSLVRQIAAVEIQANGRPAQSLSAAEQQLSASAVLLLADPLIQQVLKSATLFDLLRGALAGQSSGDTVPPGKAARLQVSHISRILGASRWRGFRNVYFTLPANGPPEQRFRLQMRFSRLTWRVIALDLPPDLVRRLAQDLAGRMRADQP
jgi:hypothetical protein